MDDAKRWAQFTYDAAAEFFDEAALGCWDRFDRATVDRLDLHRGYVVLDACSAPVHLRYLPRSGSAGTVGSCLARLVVEPAVGVPVSVRSGSR